MLRFSCDLPSRSSLLSRSLSVVCDFLQLPTLINIFAYISVFHRYIIGQLKVESWQLGNRCTWHAPHRRLSPPDGRPGIRDSTCGDNPTGTRKKNQRPTDHTGYTKNSGIFKCSSILEHHENNLPFVVGNYENILKVILQKQIVIRMTKVRYLKFWTILSYRGNLVKVPAKF